MAQTSKEYQLKQMSSEALERVYPKMERDFIPAELKPRMFLQMQMESGMETGWLLLSEDQEIGYAFVLADPSIPFALLDYLAVDRRGQGDGSAFLALLQEKYPQGMIVEVEDEMPNDDESENELRRRRMNFYQQSGFQPCSFDCDIFGVHYLVHLWVPESVLNTTNAAHLSAQAAQALSTFYRIQLPEDLPLEDLFSEDLFSSDQLPEEFHPEEFSPEDLRQLRDNFIHIIVPGEE